MDRSCQRHSESEQSAGGHQSCTQHHLRVCEESDRRGFDKIRHFATSLRQYRNLYDGCMKTTLDINDQLLADAKALAAQQRTSLTRLIEEGLQLRLRAQAAAAPPRGKLRLPVFKGRGGLVAGVDPLSNKALLEALGDDA